MLRSCNSKIGDFDWNSGRCRNGGDDHQSFYGSQLNEADYVFRLGKDAPRRASFYVPAVKPPMSSWANVSAALWRKRRDIAAGVAATITTRECSLTICSESLSSHTVCVRPNYQTPKMKAKPAENEICRKASFSSRARRPVHSGCSFGRAVDAAAGHRNMPLNGSDGKIAQSGSQSPRVARRKPREMLGVHVEQVLRHRAGGYLASTPGRAAPRIRAPAALLCL